MATLWASLFIVGLLIIVGIVLTLNDGYIVYTLDDPYIHLSVAENLLHGHYGINSHEFASPSSSILYPAILAVGLALGLGVWAPLVVNAVAMALAVWLAVDFVHRRVLAHTKDLRLWELVIWTGLPLIGLSALALPMTGMEHSLHVLLVILVVRGIVSTVEDGAPPSLGLLAAVVTMPLVRFEGIAMALVALALLVWIGYNHRSIIALGVLIAVLTAYASVMMALELPVLPSSVLVKSNVSSSLVDEVSGISALKDLTNNVAKSLVNNRWGKIYALAICAAGVAAWRALRYKRGKADVAVAALLISTLGAHMIAGRYGWFHRYEVYATVVALLAGLFLARRILPKIRWPGRVAALVGLVIVVAPYVVAIVQTPLAANGIYNQQYQMHRFATAYFAEPVAVNDIGYVSFRNENYVLDLWGLGSEEIRRLRAQDVYDAGRVATMARRHEITYAMVYEDWFGERIPDAWCHIADLYAPAPTAARDEVSIYLVNRAKESAMRDAIAHFVPTLPPKDQLRIFECSD